MSDIVVNHKDVDGDGEYKLCLYSVPPRFPGLLSPRKELKMPYGRLVGNCCNGCYIFITGRYNFFIGNLTTGEVKHFTIPLPDLVPTSYNSYFNAYGIGRRPNSDDYKVILGYKQYHPSTLETKQCALLYSPHRDSWVMVKCPNFDPEPGCVYVGDTCYWVSINWKHETSVVSFDFSTEEFNMFPLPPLQPTQKKGFYVFDIVEYGSSLGAIGHWYPDEEFYSVESSHVWVLEEKGSWKIVCTFSLNHFGKALALKDKYLLFIAEPLDDGRIGRAEVRMYNVVEGEWIGSLDMRSCLGYVVVLPCVKNPYPLPFGRHAIKSYSEEGQEEVET